MVVKKYGENNPIFSASQKKGIQGVSPWSPVDARFFLETKAIINKENICISLYLKKTRVLLMD